MTEDNQQKGTSRILRQKVVNLMYLIYVVLAFLYIPADFIDVIKEMDFSYDLHEKENIKSFEYNSLVLEAIASKLGDANKSSQFIRNSKLANIQSIATINEIEKIKQFLINKMGGYNKDDFLKNSRDYQSSEKLFIRGKLSDTIFNLINNYKNTIRPMLNNKSNQRIDSILYTGNFISSEGVNKSWENYYFDEIPMSAAIMILSKMQNDIRKTDNILIESYIKELIQSDSISIAAIRNSIINNFERLKKFYLGEEIVLAINSNNILSEKDFSKVKAYLESGKQQKPLNIDKTGNIRFYPYKEGKYKINVLFEKSIIEQKEIEVLKFRPVLENLRTPELFVGLNNRINIQHENFKGKNLLVEIDDGQVIKKQSKYYIRVYKPGIVELRVFGIENAEKKLLSTKKFKVKNLPNIRASIYGRQGGLISSKLIKLQKNINIENEIISGMNLAIKEFVVERINNKSFEVSQNTGAYFNVGTKEIINKAIYGDIYVFNNIVAENYKGDEIVLSPIILTIK
ncbi:MAG: hypothetical protein JEY97_11110 [Bacteroidales bacterium]|nr:hypothetical protein [Bacteroidales bacterium]